MLWLALLYCVVMWTPRAPVWWLTLPWAVRDATPPLGLGAALASVVLGAFPAAGAWALGACGSLRRRNPRKTLPKLEGRVLHVATLNAGMHRAPVAGVLEWIESCGADLVALQEVGEELHQALSAGAVPAYRSRLLDGVGIDGMALLARFPLSRERVFGEPLHHQVADADWGGIQVRIVNLHPYFHIAWLGLRARAAQDLPALAEAAQAGAPAVVLGDLNMPPHTRIHDVLLEAGLQDAHLVAGAGLGRTFPVPLRYLRIPLPPLLRLDHILSSAHFEPLRCQVGSDAGSDHLPLVAALRLRRRGAPR